MKKIIITAIVVAGILTLIIMLDNDFIKKENGQDYAKLEAIVLDLQQQIQQKEIAQLKYPLDDSSKEVVQKTTDEFLRDKVFDLVWKKLTHWFLLFESLDGYTLSATAPTIDGTNVNLTTSGALNNEVEVVKQPAWQGLITFSQRSSFRTAISFSNDTNQTIYATVGNKDTTHYYGFKVVGSTLYGVTYDGSTENAVSLQTITATTYNLEARYVPMKNVVFLVNAVVKGTSSANLPSSAATTNIQLMDIRVKATAVEAKTIQVSFFEYLQFRNILQ